MARTKSTISYMTKVLRRRPGIRRVIRNYLMMPYSHRDRPLPPPPPLSTHRDRPLPPPPPPPSSPLPPPLPPRDIPVKQSDTKPNGFITLHEIESGKDRLKPITEKRKNDRLIPIDPSFTERIVEQSKH